MKTKLTKLIDRYKRKEKEHRNFSVNLLDQDQRDYNYAVANTYRFGEIER